MDGCCSAAWQCYGIAGACPVNRVVNEGYAKNKIKSWKNNYENFGDMEIVRNFASAIGPVNMPADSMRRLTMPL